MSKKGINKGNLLALCEYFEMVSKDDFQYFSIIKRLKEYAIICDIERYQRYEDDHFAVVKWTKRYTRIDSDMYDWLFCRQWNKTDPCYLNVSKRIKYFVDYGLPRNWSAQLYGKAALCYL